jgi:hypothetical protein
VHYGETLADVSTMELDGLSAGVPWLNDAGNHRSVGTMNPTAQYVTLSTHGLFITRRAMLNREY